MLSALLFARSAELMALAREFAMLASCCFFFCSPFACIWDLETEGRSTGLFVPSRTAPHALSEIRTRNELRPQFQELKSCEHSNLKVNDRGAGQSNRCEFAVGIRIIIMLRNSMNTSTQKELQGHPSDQFLNKQGPA